jgi:hypothetical protein
MKRISKQSQADYQNVQLLRLSIGVAPIKKGNRVCLKCSKQFYSEDLCNMKCCYECRREENHENQDD